MRLHQNTEPQIIGRSVERSEGGIVEDAHDQQHGRRPGGPGFEQLAAIEDEILPDRWNHDRPGDLLEVGQRAPKERPVGQDGDGRRPASRIRLRERGRVETGVDSPRRR